MNSKKNPCKDISDYFYTDNEALSPHIGPYGSEEDGNAF